MRRLILGVVAGLCSTLAVTQTALAAPMDFALARLSIQPEREGCMQGEGRLCPDQALFERLMLQFGTSMVTPVTAPAATLGVLGFAVSLDTTLTTIDSEQTQWKRGTVGDGASSEAFANPDPSAVLVWNRLRVRKGLPLGFELDASMSQAMSTQAWMLGIGFKWAMVEGFRTGLGRLPDVALRASFATALGTMDSAVSVMSVDLVISKPFVVQRAWVVSPIAALQGAWLFADSDLVDLTPGVDAFEACRPRPGHQLPPEQAATIGCGAGGSKLDYGNTVVFESYRRFSLRTSLGAELRYRRVLATAALAFDLLAPTIAQANDPDPAMSRQVSFQLGAGVAF